MAISFYSILIYFIPFLRMNIGPVPRCLCECGLYMDISYAAVPISCEAIDIVKVRIRIRVKSMNVYKDSSLIASLQRMEKN